MVRRWHRASELDNKNRTLRSTRTRGRRTPVSFDNFKVILRVFEEEARAELDLGPPDDKGRIEQE
jgi:hypothetical protein